MIVRFIDENKDRFGVEPMCAQLAGLGCAFAPSTYYDARHRPRSRRAIRDEYLMELIRKAYDENYSCYGARKVWLNGIKLSWNRHQPEDDFRQRRQPGRLAVLAGLVAASGALGLAFVAASGAARNEMTVVGDLSGQVGGELVKELRGKSIRSR